MGTVPARRRTFLVVSSVTLLLLCVLTAVLVARSTADGAEVDARHRASAAAELLVGVGAQLPRLDRHDVAFGLSPETARRLDAVIERSKPEAGLAELVVLGLGGRVLYTSVDESEGARPPMDPEETAALAGRSATRTKPHELDPASGKPTGVIESVTPLIDSTGEVYGAISARISLEPIKVSAARSGRRVGIFVLAGGVLVWLLMMPLLIRLAKVQAGAWIPGRRRLLRAFAVALDHDEIELVYQPQIRTADRRVDGVEALVRWRRGGRLIGPDAFLPIVETSPLMSRLTDRVLDLGLAQLSRWRAAGIVLRMSINLSATDISDDKLPQRLASKLSEHGVMGQSLTVEVTETALFDDADQAQRVLTTIDQMGVDLAIDDFGTGHASIARLHGLPICEVKIDRSFVSDAGERSRSYLTAMIGFADAVGLRIVAEGVEDAETLAILTTLGCGLAQGYHVSRPLEPAAMTHWLTTADPSSIGFLPTSG